MENVLPVIQGISPYLEFKDLLVVRLLSKSCKELISSGDVKLIKPMRFKHSIRGEAVAFVACIASKTLIFSEFGQSEPLDRTFVHNMLTMSQGLTKLVMINDDIPEGFQYPRNITFNGLFPFCFQNFGAFQNVTHLQIENPLVNLTTLIHLLDNKYLPNICKIKLWPENACVGVIQAIAKLSKLERLTISTCHEPILHDSLRTLGSSLKHMKNLKRLHLRNIGLGPAGLSAFIEEIGASLEYGQHLNIEGFKIDNNPLGYLLPLVQQVVEIGTYMPMLQSLNISSCKLNHMSAKVITELVRKLPKLKNITLGSNPIGPRGMAEIIDALPSTIEQLYLHGCVDDSVDKEIFANALVKHVSTNSHIWGFGLNGNYFHGYDVYRITKHLPRSLRDFGITNVNLTDEFVECIGAELADRCPQIRYVYLYRTGFKAAERVTEDGLLAFRKKLAKTSGILVPNHGISRYIKHA